MYENMKNQTVCFTGHRKIPADQKLLDRALTYSVEAAINNGYRYFGAGGALGFDTAAALAVIRARKVHPDVRLILVLPCREQAARWSERDKKLYERIKEKADKVIYTSEDYFNGCMQKRNRHLVDNSSLCLCYLTEPRGGTYYTVKYAEKKGIKIINIANLINSVSLK